MMMQQPQVNPGVIMDNEKFRINRVMFFPMPMQHPMFSRPYIVHPDGHALNTLYERMQMSGSSTVNTGMLSDITNAIIAPSTVPVPTPINSNWFSQPRYIFIIIVESMVYQTSRQLSYLTGFTDHDGIMNRNLGGQTIEPRMMLYVNSVIETKITEMNLPTGPYRKESLEKFYDVIKPFEVNQIMHAQRPKDVISTMEVLDNQSHLMAAGTGATFTHASNAANVLSANAPIALPSKTTNNVALDFLATVVNGGIKARKDKLNTSDMVKSYKINHSQPVDLEPMMHNNRVLNKLAKLEGNARNTGVFSYNSLLRLDVEGANKYQLMKVKKNTHLDRTGRTEAIGETWHGQDPITTAAYSLLGGALSLAVEKGIFELDIHINNMNGAPLHEVVKISHFESPIKLDANDTDHMLQSLVNKFIYELYMPETMGGSYPIQASIFIDLVGVTKIHMSLLGQPFTWYTMPTATNSYSTPIITPDPNFTRMTGEKLNMVVHQVANNTQNYVTPTY